jgi:predicted membrane protein (TIGR00267 family)
VRSPRKNLLLPLVLGLTDGTLNTLVLAAGRVTSRVHNVSLGLALRVAASALASGVFVYFVARYAELRAELVHAERELNLTSHGRLAVTRLGRQVFVESVWSAAVASVSAFFGSLVPFAPALMAPQYPLAPVFAALAVLGGLGAGLARVTYASAWRWSISLVFGGVLFWWVGAKLKIL